MCFGARPVRLPERPKVRLYLVDHDGTSRQEELRTLASAGLVSISLDYRESKRTDRFGNEFRYWVHSEWLGGKVQTTWNVFLTAE